MLVWGDELAVEPHHIPEWNTYTDVSAALPTIAQTLVPSQPSLRPFDIAVALRLVLVPEDRYEPLALALATSTSAVHRSVARLQHAGICGAAFSEKSSFDDWRAFAFGIGPHRRSFL